MGAGVPERPGPDGGGERHGSPVRRSTLRANEDARARTTDDLRRRGARPPTTSTRSEAQRGETASSGTTTQASSRRKTLPLDLPRVAGGELPGFFKVFGLGDDVWVVGAAGAILHRKGSAPFAVVPTTTKDTLFTVHGVGDRVIAVGGAGNGVLLEGTTGTFHDASPPAAGLIQGIFTTDRGDWASGERGVIYTRPSPERGAFTAVDHGLTLPAVSSLHSIFVDDTGGVWSAGGNVLSPALDDGMLVHYGDRVPPVVIEEDEAAPDAGAGAACPAAIVAAGKDGSIARRWDEQALAAIRLDLPRPPIHARNLFHLSAAMWDAWAGYDAKASGVFVRERHTAEDVAQARRTAISYAAYGLLSHRYRAAVGGPRTMACLRAVMADLGYDPDDAHDTATATIRSRSGTASRMRWSRRWRATARTRPNDYADTFGLHALRIRRSSTTPRARRSRSPSGGSRSISPSRRRRTASSSRRGSRSTSARSGAASSPSR